MKVYYAKMNVTPQEQVAKDLNLLYSMFGAENVIMHHGGKYDPFPLKECTLLFVTGFNFLNKGKGVYSQISDFRPETRKIWLMPTDVTNTEVIERLDNHTKQFIPFRVHFHEIRSASVTNADEYYQEYCTLSVNHEGLSVKQMKTHTYLMGGAKVESQKKLDEYGLDEYFL